MSRYRKLGPCFFCLEMEYGKLDLTPSHNFSCFFILNKSYSSDYIHEQALQLLLAGPLEIVVYGKAAEVWHMELTSLQSAIMTNAALAISTSVEDFADTLYRTLRARPLVPHDTFLVYDTDFSVVRKVLQMTPLSLLTE